MRNSGSGHRAILGAAWILATLSSASAQTQAQSPDQPLGRPPAASPQSAPAGTTSGAPPASSASEPAAASPETTSSLPTSDPIDSNLVDVSLGDWALKNELATQLQVKVSQIPLTVAVSSDVASQVCPIGHDELDQQKVTNATRTCAAKQMTDELRETVRTQLRDTTAN